MESLFSNERIDFDLPNTEVIYFLSYLNNNEATELFQHFKCKIKLENAKFPKQQKLFYP